MSRTVLDASAILAVINAERGHEKLTPVLLKGAAASAVNLAEVQGKLVSRGWSSRQAWQDATGFVSEVIAFDQRQAKIAGDFVFQTKRLGLSLGDRACLALARVLEADVYTAETTWRQLSLGILIHVIR